MKQWVRIVIPVYKEKLENEEAAALKNNVEKLAAYPITFVAPIETPIRWYAERYPQAEILLVSSDWLGTKCGIAGYNTMMLSKEFYMHFADTEYILICHADAWIFRDELRAWCAKGYDQVAAPWPTRRRYMRFPLKPFWRLYLRFLRLTGRKSRHLLCGRVGNGGLCLRKTASFIAACDKYQAQIAFFKAQSDAMFNEDVFWAFVPQEFRYPTELEALQFAFDLKPRLCFDLNHKRLPMGCHSFNKGRKRLFWKTFIPCLRSSSES